MGSYIGNAAPQAQWLGEKVEDLVGGVQKMAGVSHKHPNTVSVVLQNRLQQEWAIVHSSTQVLGEGFRTV